MTASGSAAAAASRNDGCHVLYVVTSSLSLPFLQDQLDHLISLGVKVSVASGRANVERIAPASLAGSHEVAFKREPNLVGDVRALWQLVRLIRRIRPTTVNAATPKAGLLGMLAARVCRVPQRVYVVWGLRFETAHGRTRTLFRLLERLAMRCATDVLFNSASVRDVAVRERLVTIERAGLLGDGAGNCVDMSRFDDLPTRETARRSVGIDPDENVVGFVGRLTKDKGIDDLIGLFAVPTVNARLLLVGSIEDGDPISPASRSAIESSDRIVHTPWMDDPRIAFAAMDVLAFASYREGLPNVPIEAQRCRVPVVAYAATGTVDAVAHDVGGRLVDVGDVEALGRELSALIDDPDRRRELGEGGRAFVLDRLDPTRCWDQLVELYTQ